MTRDPRQDPQAGDRWRTAWGVSTVSAVERGQYVIMDPERLSWEDWLWSTSRAPGKGGGWVYVGVAS